MDTDCCCFQLIFVTTSWAFMGNEKQTHSFPEKGAFLFSKFTLKCVIILLEENIEIYLNTGVKKRTNSKTQQTYALICEDTLHFTVEHFELRFTPLAKFIITHINMYSVIFLIPSMYILPFASNLHRGHYMTEAYLFLHMGVGSAGSGGQNKHVELTHCCFGLLKEKKCRLDRSWPREQQRLSFRP